jgi:2-succinyl-6-hydroxy-2,4-cyclohexadiene-1-carboxylate synthase
MLELHFISGFLGRAEDWKDIAALLKEKFQVRIFCHSVLDFAQFPTGSKAPIDAFSEWACRFLESLDKTSQKNNKRILVGYSLGARLAMHVLLKSPGEFDGFICVSGHCGLSEILEREQRKINDLAWSKKLLEMEPNFFLKEWNNQSVFGGYSIVEEKRNLKKGEAEKWSQILLAYSLANQEFLLPELKNVNVPIYFISGSSDKKFTALHATYLQSLNLAKHFIVKDSFHRVPWENQEVFVNVLAEIIEDYK